VAKVGIVSIATNHYIAYWEELVTSSREKLFINDSVKFHLFTDKKVMAIEFARNNIDLDICIHEIPSFGWPEATLLRFSIITSEAKHFDEEFLVYLDADMRVLTKSEDSIRELLPSGKMTLVRHPGYFRGFGLARFSLYLSSPKLFFGDIMRLTRLGGIGSWETNRLSQAFVPRQKRKIYFCGGIWGGPRDLFLSMCGQLSAQVERDLSLDYIAMWHDESHLNQWASENSIKVLGPEYCFEPTYKNLRGIEGIIEAVNKSESPNRISNV
jgi:hypothetical protein